MLVHEGETRSPAADRALALSLAGVAGALNTAGFYAVGLYASNMTGNVSAISDRICPTHRISAKHRKSTKSAPC